RRCGEVTRPSRERGIGRDDRATAACRDDFIAVEAEGAQRAKRTRGPPLERRAERFGRVFNHGYFEFSGKFQKLHDATGVAEAMHGEQRRDAPPTRAVDPRPTPPLADFFEMRS